MEEKRVEVQEKVNKNYIGKRRLWDSGLHINVAKLVVYTLFYSTSFEEYMVWFKFQISKIIIIFIRDLLVFVKDF